MQRQSRQKEQTEGECEGSAAGSHASLWALWCKTTQKLYSGVSPGDDLASF